ncbi:S41 family peptidase [Chryseobacterium arthrosphaerae]|uniref:S41 family peptidase n=1 Tax=Chryseobacterium arthrosphaerae TaxID=651561 RepID=UPI0023E2C6BC|nr:S41 family peptidase [Chryseobacterium arthrosphaerae]WES95890.1 S41 family peptidase [Chryseobacterium arthrosphaerae]
MKKKFIAFLMLLPFVYQGQSKIDNLSFESVENNLPKSWSIIGDSPATISIDNKEKQDGQYSVLAQSAEKGMTGLIYTLPENYAGKKITISGYIKTENLTDGFAGIWMRIDPKVGFDNMQSKNIKGTTPWTKYETTLTLSPENSKKIVVGTLFTGKGKAWFDNIRISIDGKDIQDAVAFQKPQVNADLDHEFDKGSKISSIDTGKKNMDNLKNLGLIWGYLKYYHPNVAGGKYNWDYELFRILPKISGASAKQRDEILADWIKGLGTFQTEKFTFDTKNVKIAPDLNWITNSGFSKELSDLLLQLKDAKRPKANYYVDFYDNIGNPDFSNEKPYENEAYPDAGFRLLSLYKYWNIIQYYFPYKNLIREDWKEVLPEFIPKFADAKNETDYTLAALEIIARIHDTHANVWGSNKALDKYFGARHAPVKLTFAENKAIVSSYINDQLGKESGLQTGDIITEINGKPVDHIVKEMLKISPASNYATQLRDIARKLLRSNSETMNIKISRNGKTESLAVKTFEPKELNIKKEPKDFFKMLDNQTGYFYMGSADGKKLSESFDKLRNTKGIVIDLRSYPSDFVVFSMGKLLKKDSSDFVKFTQTTNQMPGLFTFTPNLGVEGNGPEHYKGKIAILINETTQSSAEYHTMAFRTAPNSKVFGSTTAGADGNVSRILLPGNISTMISGIGIYYPDGTETQRIGIVPDVEIKPTVEGIKNGKDEVLDKALEWIKS